MARYLSPVPLVLAASLLIQRWLDGTRPLGNPLDDHLVRAEVVNLERHRCETLLDGECGPIRQIRERAAKGGVGPIIDDAERITDGDHRRGRDPQRAVQ